MRVHRRATSVVVLLAALLTGCADVPPPRTPAEVSEMLSAREARLHPVFTKIADFTADGRSDGIDALVELHDQFGDTTKGAGTFTFELFQYRTGQPDPRGERLSDPWVVEVSTPAQQRERWSRASRCYNFRLAAPAVTRQGNYVLTLVYSPAGGGPRSFDRVVLSGVPGSPDAPSGAGIDTSGGPPAPGPQGSIDSLPPR